MNSSRKESVGPCRSGPEVYGARGVLASSADLCWSGFSAELRIHTAGVIEWKNTRQEIEVCVALSAGNYTVTRSGGGVVERTIAQRGTAWLCPEEEHLVDVSAPEHEVLHIYLPSKIFFADSLGVDLSRAVPASLAEAPSFRDPMVAEMAFAIAAELWTPTAGGKLLAETLAVSLAARLMQPSTGRPTGRVFTQVFQKGLDRRRLTRVQEYIAANLEEDLTIARLADVASLSRFHFARAFKAAVGQSPHQYVSALRLERARELLTRGDQSVLDVAIALNFSSQANFTRAFHQRLGMTPGQYRRGFQRLGTQTAQRCAT